MKTASSPIKREEAVLIFFVGDFKNVRIRSSLLIIALIYSTRSVFNPLQAA